LPAAVVNVVEVGACVAGGKPASVDDRRAGIDAALQRACVDMHRFPGAGDTARQRLRFGAPVLGERQLLASAKALRRDAFDMTMAREQDLGHAADARCRTTDQTLRIGMENASSAPVAVNAAMVANAARNASPISLCTAAWRAGVSAAIASGA